jgi:hypothetical protein
MANDDWAATAQGSMREGELEVAEEEFIDFKFKFRNKTTDRQPEVLLFLDLWSLLVDIGGDETPDEDGVVPRGNTNPLFVPKETYWDKDNDMAWALSCDSGLTPSDVKEFLKRLYIVNSSPLKLDGQPGISFKEYWNVLMGTPMIFESATQGDLGELDDWEAFRLAYKEDAASAQPPSYEVSAAMQCLSS